MIVKDHRGQGCVSVFRMALAVSLCVAAPVMAGVGQSGAPGTSSEQPIETSVTERADHQTFRAETFRAKEWGLDEPEWQRYQSLMQGIRGSVSPATLSPIEVLGIHARSAEERRRYAEQWAAMMRDDAERILAFQRAYDDAQRRLFPNGFLIDPGAVASTKQDQGLAEKFAWQPSDRVLFFTDTQCPTCDAVLERLVSQITQFSGIDLYLIDVFAGEESRIREWAASKQIDPQWVSEHKITLNIDGGALGKVSAHTGLPRQELPVLILRRGDRLMPLPVSRF